MPDFEIKGDPAGIRSRASTMVKKADLFSGTGSALRDLDTKKGWYGRSAERFGDKNDQEPNRWWEAGGAFRSGGTALNTYADALEHAQNEAARAKEEYQRGEDATREAKAAYAEYEGRYNKLKSQAISDGLEYPWAKEPFTDPGEELRKNALEIYAAAKRGREAAARACAADVRSACRNAPEKRNWLENRIHSNIEMLKGAAEATWELVEMGFSKYNPQWQMTQSMLRGLGLMDESELTTEELKMQFQLDGETLEQAWQAAKKDPLEFGKQLGKGMLDWDTWADNPARAVGHLLPDIIAGILTGGTAGAASRGLRMGADAIDAISDMGRTTSGLNRAADAMDNLGDSMNITKNLFSGGVPTPDVPAPDVPSARGVPETPPAPTAGPPPHGSAPTPDSATAAPPGHGAPGSESSSDPMSRLESRMGSISDTGQSFLESRLGGHGETTPGPTPDESPLSQPGDDSAPSIREPEVDDHAGPEDPLRPDPSHTDDSTNAEPDVDSLELSDRDGPQPTEDPVHVEDHVKPEEGLNGDDYPNTQDYAGEAYNRINPYLRGEYDAPPFIGADDMIDGVKRELDSLPPTQEVSHRGMYMERSTIDQLFGGERFSDPAFLSTSKSPDVANNWIDELHDSRDPEAAPKEKILVRVEGHSGRDISDISLNSGEKEILFKPGTEFDVVGRHWNDTDGRWEIDLREVGHPHPGGSHDDGPGGTHGDDHPESSSEENLRNEPDTSDTPSHEADPAEDADADTPTEWSAGQHDALLDAELPHLDVPESIEESVKKVNELGYWADKGRFGNNCHNVVEALELRARGYDVTASPTVEGGELNGAGDGTHRMPPTFEGRYLPNIESGWRQKDGSIREFDYLSDHGTESPAKSLEAYGKDLPAGARGFITGSWSNGGAAHIFSFTKEADGSIRLFDGQTNTPDASSHLDNMHFNQREQNPWNDIRVMRVDDLKPTEEILQAARPDTAETKAETVSWGHGLRSGDPLQLPESMVQRELDANQHWRERNESLFTKFEDIQNDPNASTSEKSQAAGMLQALREQNHRLDWGRYNVEMRIHEARTAHTQTQNGAT
ncbi:putative T7SS-secreted protein [Nocardioides sp. CCNWLW239]|uniref:putative T7SS-secreted protein n=1 Tax=Nocardioides sp. CCNWLW239 TaxID=3128902 RepID=UPI00301AF318